MDEPFAPSLFVEIRKRMGQSVFEVFQGANIDDLENAKMKKKSPSQSRSAKCKCRPGDDHDDPPSASGDTSQEEGLTHHGNYPECHSSPTGDPLSHREAREFSEQIIDRLYPKTDEKKKPRIYREKARKAYLAFMKQRWPAGKVRRRGIKLAGYPFCWETVVQAKESHRSEPGRHPLCVDQQHLPGDELSDPAEDLFCAV